MPLETDLQQLRCDLLTWFDASQRDLPWRRTRDPYAILVSEIMLQQTRVAAVLPFYGRFLSRFPDFLKLAEAPESELLACWAGLGYYHRARNLQRAAMHMRERGAFPDTYVEIRKLPGVGDYTAAAVASIAFDLPHAALDGNVLRVVSRVFDDAIETDTAAGRKHFGALAALLLDTSRPGAFNQAMMELGATVCFPKKPQCLVCPIVERCEARRKGTQELRPVKAAAVKNIEEDRVVFWIVEAGKVLAWQRPPQSKLMAGFWELPERTQIPAASVGRTLGAFRHGITFHSYRFEVRAAAAPLDLGPCEWVSMDELSSLPLSTVMRKAKRLADRGRKPAGTLRSVTASV